MADPLKTASQADPIRDFLRLTDIGFGVRLNRKQASDLAAAIRALASPAPSPSRDAAVAADHALAPVAVEGMIRDAVLDEASDRIKETSFAERFMVAQWLRSLKGQPPPSPPSHPEVTKP